MSKKSKSKKSEEKLSTSMSKAFVCLEEYKNEIKSSNDFDRILSKCLRQNHIFIEDAGKRVVRRYYRPYEIEYSLN